MKQIKHSKLIQRSRQVLVMLLFFGCAMLHNSAEAQNISYFKSYGANFGEQGNVVAQLSNGNVATGMQLSHPSGGGLVYPGLLLTDETGEKIFCKKYLSIGHPSSIEHLIPNGQGFLIGGTSNGMGWFIQTDSLGVVLWSETVAIGNALHVTDLISDSNGYIGVGITNYNTGSYPEIVCFKMDAAGQVQWSKQIETTNYHLRNVKLIKHNNDIFIAGTGKINFNFFDVFIMRLDSAASPLWTKHFDTTYDDELEEFLIDEAGDFYLIGRNYNIGSAWDVFIQKVDADGNQLLTKHFDGNNGDEQTRCATFLDNETLAINFDEGNGNSRSPAVMSINLNDFSVNWCKRYAYEPQFTNYVIDMIATPNKGVVLVGDMHVIGKIRDTYLIRTLPNGDAGCYTYDYVMNEIQVAFTDSLLFDSSHDIANNVVITTIITEEAFEIIEFSACSSVPPVAAFNTIEQTVTNCESACYAFSDTSEFSPSEWIWTFENASPAQYIGQNPPEVCWTENGTYAVTLTVNSNDGSSTSTQTVAVDLNCAPIVPNVFSPNNDGKNDFLDILYLPSRFQLTVFNRWGNSVFESDDPTKHWTGQNEQHGQEATAGTYFYELIDLSTNTSYTGYVHLIR